MARELAKKEGEEEEKHPLVYRHAGHSLPLKLINNNSHPLFKSTKCLQVSSLVKEKSHLHLLAGKSGQRCRRLT